MSKNQFVPSSKPQEKISICDFMKTNTSQIIQKLESQVPIKFQQFSDLYTTYLHSLDDLYGTCYLSEKEFFDKLNIDQGILRSFKDYNQTVTEALLNQIDLSAKFRQEMIQMQISALQINDNFLHSMMESYAKSLSLFNKAINSSNK